MAGILEVLTQSGSIPLDELKIRSTGSDADIEERVKELEDQGLLTLTTKKLAADLETPTTPRETVVELTTKGLRSALRGVS